MVANVFVVEVETAGVDVAGVDVAFWSETINSDCLEYQMTAAAARRIMMTIIGAFFSCGV